MSARERDEALARLAHPKSCAVRRQLSEEDIRRECESKGVPTIDHPGTAYHLCHCGNFHLNPGYAQIRTPLGWTAQKLNLGG